MLMKATSSPLSRLGWCVECGDSYPATKAEDELCPKCAADDDALYANDPVPAIELPPASWTKAAMRERLGVCGDEDA